MKTKITRRQAAAIAGIQYQAMASAIRRLVPSAANNDRLVYLLLVDFASVTQSAAYWPTPKEQSEHNEFCARCKDVLAFGDLLTASAIADGMARSAGITKEHDLRGILEAASRVR